MRWRLILYSENSRTSEGPDGYSAATVVAAAFRRHPLLKKGVLDELIKVGETVQQETLDAIQNHWTADWFNGLASATGLGLLVSECPVGVSWLPWSQAIQKDVYTSLMP